MNAAGALLEEIVDYAGLFPPAGLSMARAVENYAAYARGPRAWMLGKFVVPAARLREFATEWEKLPEPARETPFHLSLILGADLDGELAAARQLMDDMEEIIEVRSLELKAATPEAVRAAGMAIEELPEVSQVFIEVPAKNPGASIAAIASIGLCAKLRTGGVTPDAFPSAAEVIGFMRACIDAVVPFKATAGLHHAVGAAYPLTYADNAPSAPMFGFLNVFLAAGVLSLRGSDADALAILEDTDAGAFEFSEAHVTWRGLRMSTSALHRLRTRGAAAFGSCSFTEPVADLERMGVLA